MTILFIGQEREAFRETNPGAITVSTPSGEANFNRGYISIDPSSGSSLSRVVFASGQTSLWVHFRNIENPAGTSDGLRIIDNAGTVIVRIRRDSTGWLCQRWDGSTYQDVGTSLLWDTGQRITFDVFVSLDNSAGQVMFFVGGDLNGSFTGDTIHGTTSSIAEVAFRAMTINDVIITNSEPTIGWRVKTSYPTADGALMNWSGAYTDVSAFDLDDTSIITSTSGGEDFTVVGDDLAAALNGFEVAAVTVAARVKNDGAGPSGVEPIVRIGSTVYTTGVSPLEYDTTLDVAFRNFVRVWELNPATAAQWTISEVEAAQYGVRSIT